MHGDKLPHWEQDGVMQFVTFRLGDALPKSQLDQWRTGKAAWLAINPEPWSEEQRKEYHEQFTGKIEAWLDSGLGSCLLRDPANRKVVEDVLAHDHGRRATHFAWVIMPNHVHVLFTPHADLARLVGDWKSLSARRIGKGSIWQANYRDTLIRDSRHFAAVVRYIRRNPRGLADSEFSLWESERALEVEGEGS